MLARAVATECRTTFFNISASSIVSKYRGDSEKLIRVLFDLARYHSPSTIFIDEIDSLMSSRDSTSSGEHEGSRRMKTELLIQMDGLNQSSDLVFVLAASNLPWDLDMALLRRLEKRILVPLPTVKGREIMMERSLKGRYNEKEVNLRKWAERLDMYSGADVQLLCKEVAMRPVRRLMKKLLTIHTEEEEEHMNNEEIVLDLINNEDFEKALKCTKPSSSKKFLDKYEEWHQTHGATIEAD